MADSTPVHVRGTWAGQPASLSGARRLVADLFRPLRDLDKIAGLDQLVRLEPGEGARASGRQAHRGRGLRVRQLDDRQPVVLPEHPVVGLQAAADRLRQPVDDSCPIRLLGDKPLDGLPRHTEQDRILRRRYPQYRHAAGLAAAARQYRARRMRDATLLTVQRLVTEGAHLVVRPARRSRRP